MSATQLVKNNYELAIDFTNGTFFAGNCTDKDGSTLKFTSKSKLVMVSDSGKAVSVKNSIGFDKIYRPSTAVGVCCSCERSGYYYSFLDDSRDLCCIIVGKGKKYSAILSNGKFLEKGKLFDSIASYNGTITATSGNKTTVYESDGKVLMNATGKDIGTFVDYDPASKNVIMYVHDSTKEGYDRSQDKIVLMSSKGKVIKKFEETYSGEFEKINGTTYLRVGNDYYTTNGKKTTVKEAAPKTNLTYTIKDKKGTPYLVVTDKKGKVIYETVGRQTFGNGDSKGNGNDEYMNTYMYNDGKMIIAWGKFVIIDDATGKIVAENSDHKYWGIQDCSKDNKHFIVTYGEEKNSYGSYDRYKSVLINDKGKAISSSYSKISPLGEFDGDVSYSIDGSKGYGIINSKGKVIVKPVHDDIYCYCTAATLFGDNYDEYSLYDNYTGKKLLSKLNLKSYGFMRDSSKAFRLITQNSDGNKFGCIVVKVA